MYHIGVAKTDITAFKLGVGMLGYGMYFNIVKGVDTDLFARAVVIKDLSTGRKVAMVNAEICFITIAVKKGVMKRLERKHPELGYTEDSVLLTAQHTHSAPGGYSHYGLYNMAVPGFVPEVYQTIVDGIVDAIIQADAKAVPATIRVLRGEIDPTKEVAFNRSVPAYNSNPEVKKVGEKESEYAVDRSMLLLRFDDAEGNPIGSWNFFGTHTTSISNDNTLICSDNKGYAALFMEKALRKEGSAEEVVSVFAQRKAGDVTPNYVWDRKKRWTRGKFADDFESARYNGNIQFEKALDLFKAAPEGQPLPLQIDHAITWVNFRHVVVDPEFAWGEKEAYTSPGCHGIGFFGGTKEGPGAPGAVVALGKALARGIRAYELAAAKKMPPEQAEKIHRKYHAQDPKDIILEDDECKVLGTKDLKNLILPAWADGGIAAFKHYHRNGSIGDKPLIPQVLPLHLIIVGDLAFAGIPAEITTVAGQRLEQTLLDILKDRGVKEVVATSYANAYCGYVTTFQEYQLQLYEAGHTVFGKHTLGAVQTRFKRLALELLKPKEERTPMIDGEPALFTDEELAKRTFNVKVRRRQLKGLNQEEETLKRSNRKRTEV
jgi:neutral ceramidase